MVINTLNKPGAIANLSMSLANGKSAVDQGGNLYSFVGYEIFKYNITSRSSSLIELTGTISELQGKNYNQTKVLSQLETTGRISINPITNVTFISMSKSIYKMFYNATVDH